MSAKLTKPTFDTNGDPMNPAGYGPQVACINHGTTGALNGPAFMERDYPAPEFVGVQFPGYIAVHKALPKK